MSLEDLLNSVLPEGPWKIFEAMAYTPRAGGKRLRSNVLLKSAEDLGVKDVEDMAVAVELFHSGTLIHDDLPSIDDAVLRRGKETNHRVFGEGMAVLAGDGLFFLAFKVISKHPRVFPEFAEVALDVLIGEAMDVEMEEIDSVEEEDILEMYEKKTGALFGFSFCAPALEIGDPRAERLKHLGRRFGVAFQMFDDVKDAVSDEKTLGKDVGKDAKKKTLVKRIGLDKTLERAEEIYDRVISELEEMGMDSLGGYLERMRETVRRL